MSFASILIWMICGLVVGLLARYIVPGPHIMNVPMTILVGIGGALLGGVVFSLVEGASVELFSITSHNWYGWIFAILGGMLMVWAYPYLRPRNWWI